MDPMNNGGWSKAGVDSGMVGILQGKEEWPSNPILLMEIRHSPVEVGSLSHYLQGSIHSIKSIWVFSKHKPLQNFPLMVQSLSWIYKQSRKKGFTWMTIPLEELVRNWTRWSAIWILYQDNYYLWCTSMILNIQVGWMYEKLRVCNRWATGCRFSTTKWPSFLAISWSSKKLHVLCGKILRSRQWQRQWSFWSVPVWETY